MVQKKQQAEQQYLDPKLAIELKKLERSLKKAFGAVKRDINIFYGEFARFKLSVSNQVKDLKITDGKINELLALNQTVQKLNSSVDELKQSMKKFADKENTKDELEDLNKRFGDYVETTKYDERLKEVDRQLEARNVKIIDLAKIETKLNTLKKDIDDLHDVEGDLKSLKEDFIGFKKTALTKYNVDKHEKWVKELEKDLLQLISLRKKVDALSTVKEVESMRRIAAQNIKEQDDLKVKFDNVSKFKQDFDRLKANSENATANLRKELSAANSNLSRLQKSHEAILSELKELKRVSQIEKDVGLLGKKVQKLEKIKPTVIVKEKKVKVKTPKKAIKAKKSKKKGKGTTGQRFFDWLVEEE